MSTQLRDECAVPPLSLTPTIRTNALAVFGFCLMLAGPLVLLMLGWLWGMDNIPEAVNWAVLLAFALPIAGTTVAHVALDRWRVTGRLGRVLAIITVVMCNPFFFVFYMLICVAMVGGLDTP